MEGQDLGKELHEVYPHRDALSGSKSKVFLTGPRLVSQNVQNLAKMCKFTTMARKK